MATIRVASDNMYGKSADTQVLNTFAEKLRAAGHTVTTHGIGPNRIQQTMLKSSNKCDIMIQIAGGKCLGTLVDFYKGLNRYYHAKVGGFAYYKCWDANWKAVRAHDDRFSRASDLQPYLGKTLPQIYQSMSGMYYGYGTTAEGLAQTWLQNYSGTTTTSSSSSGTANASTSILELIKQVTADWDKYGVEYDLTGDTMTIQRTNPNTATILDESMILNNSVSITDYDSNTPNINGKARDEYLINRFGQIPLDEEINSTWEDQVLLMAQRNHEHSIDLKCLIDPSFVAGKWVTLDMPIFGINKRKYYITKSSYDDDVSQSVTLEPGPPSRFVEVQEEESTDTEETESEE